MPEVGELYVKITARMDEFERQMKRLEGDTPKRMQKMAEKSGQQMLTTFGSYANKAGNAMTLGLTLPIAALGKKAFDAAVGMEKMELGMTAIMGSAKAATNEIENLRVAAQKPGLGFQEAVNASMKLQGVGLSANEARKQIEAFANANARVGGSKDNFNEILRQWGQMQSLGKVTAENLNIISERLPGFYKVMKEKFNTANTEIVQDAIKNGRLTMAQFVTGMTDGLKALPGVMNSTQNELDNLSDLAQQSFAEIGKDLIPIAKEYLPKVTRAIKDLIAEWKKLDPDQKEGMFKWAAAFAVSGPLMKGLGGAASMLSGMVKSAKWLNDNLIGIKAPSWMTNAGGAGAGGGALAGVATGAPLAAIATTVGSVAAGSYAAYRTFWGDLKDQRGMVAGKDSESALSKDRERAFQDLKSKLSSELSKKDSKSAIANILGISGIGGPWAGGKDEVKQILERLAWSLDPKNQVSKGGFFFGMQDTVKKPGSGVVMDLGGSGSGKGGTSKTTDDITADLLVALGKAVTTPKGQPSCAYFASEVLKQTGVAVSKEGSAKALIDAVKKKGGVEVKRSAARAGDLVYYYGDGIGDIDHDPNKKGQQGYHVGIYKGDGTVVDSSGEVKRYNRGVGANAHFVRPLRSGRYQNVGDVSMERADTVEAARQEAEKAAKDAAEENARQWKQYKETLLDSLRPIREFQWAKQAEQMRSGGAMRYDVISTREFGKPFLDLSDEANKNRVRAIAMGEVETEEQSRRKSMRDRAKGKWGDIFDLAKDQAGERKDRAGQWGKYKDAWSSVFNKAGKEDSRLDRQSLKEYADQMQNLDERMVKVSGSSAVASMRLKGLTDAFLMGRKGPEAYAEATRRAKEVIEYEAKVLKAEQWRQIGDQLAREITAPLRDALGDLVRLDFPDFLNSLGGLLDRIVQTVASRQIELVVQNGIGNLIGGALSGLFGGNSRPTIGLGNPDGASDGGSVVSATNGMTSRSYSAAQTVQIVINATDAASVIQSKDQIAYELSQTLNQVQRMR